MKSLVRIGSILIALSLGTLLGRLILNVNSTYHDIPVDFSNSRYVAFITYLHNRETELLMDLKKNAKTNLIVMNQAQIQDLLTNNEISYSACFNLTGGGISKDFGRIEQGIYIFAFWSEDENQVVRFQVVQKGFELDLVYFNILLILLGSFLLLIPFFKRIIPRRILNE
ncbi:MAG: hypothetical protein QXN75_00395 [Thermoproteota archaeon]